MTRDAADLLRAFHDRILLPPTPDGTPAIYLAGHSLGLQQRTARAAAEAKFDAWAHLGVDARFVEDRPRFTLLDRIREPMARVVDARPSDVAILNALTANLRSGCGG